MPEVTRKPIFMYMYTSCVRRSTSVVDFSKSLAMQMSNPLCQLTSTTHKQAWQLVASKQQLVRVV